MPTFYAKVDRRAGKVDPCAQARTPQARAMCEATLGEAKKAKRRARDRDWRVTTIRDPGGNNLLSGSAGCGCGGK